MAARIAALPRPEVDGLRWTMPEHWHVTLRFLGDADPGEAAAALAAVDAPVATAHAGPALERFGDRVLHLPVEGLQPVAAAVVVATSHLGKPPDTRPFHGHITLARPRGRSRVKLAPLTGVAFEATWEADTISLVSSTLGAGGSRYDVLQRFRLEAHQR